MRDVRVLAPKSLRDRITLKLTDGLRRNTENEDGPNNCQARGCRRPLRKGLHTQRLTGKTMLNLLYAILRDMVTRGPMVVAAG
jgi:hypothetical protein